MKFFNHSYLLVSFSTIFILLGCRNNNKNIVLSNFVFNEGMIYLDKGDYKNAYLKFTEAINLNQENKFAYYQRALSIEVSEDKYDEIIENCQAVLELDPYFDSAYIPLIGPFAEKHGRYNAIELLNVGLQNNPASAILYMLRGVLYYHIEDYANSIKDLENSININKNSDSYTHFFLGKARFRNRDYYGGIGAFDEALKIDPREVESYFWRGACKSELKMNQQAIEDYTKCIELDIRKDQALQN